MPLFDPSKRKRVGGPYPPEEKPVRREAMPQSPGGDEIDFDFPVDDCDGEEDEGPPYEPDLDEHVEVAPPPVSPLPRKPLKKPLVQPAAVSDTRRDTSTGAALKTVATGEPIKKVQLSCHLSFEHHRRLRIHCIMTGQTVLSIVEGWIEEHCPPL